MPTPAQVWSRASPVVDSIRLFAGDCRVRFDDGSDGRDQRGHVVVVCKPDRTTLVHDTSGYQPVAWLTRPDDLTVADDDEGFRVVARGGERRLVVESVAVAGRATLPVSPAGVPVGEAPADHPEASGPLVRVDGAVVALDSGTRYPLVAGATTLERRCEDCGLPLMAVERGAAFEVCLDRSCEPLDDAVVAAFDGAWTCPDCGAPSGSSGGAAACSPAVTALPAARRRSRSPPESSPATVPVGSPSSRRRPADAVSTAPVTSSPDRSA